MPSKKTDEPPAPPQPRRSFLSWVVGIVVVVAVIVVFGIPQLTIWIHTRGKVTLRLEPEAPARLNAKTTAEMERVLTQRADVLGLKETYIRRAGGDIVVAFKPPENLDAVVKTLSARGDLNIRPVPREYQPKITNDQIYLVGPEGGMVRAEEALKDVEPIIRRSDLRTEANLRSDPETDRPIVRIFLDTPAEQALAAWYGGHPDSFLAISFDGRVESVAKPGAAIAQYADIQGIFTREQARTMVDCLKTDPLPIKVRAQAPRVP